MAHLFTQPHQNYNKKNIEQPSLRTIRYKVEWNSDIYGIKETTSIQIGRRGADVEWAGPTLTCGGYEFGSGERSIRTLNGNRKYIYIYIYKYIKK